MKKIVSTALILVLCIAAFSACSIKKGTIKDETVLSNYQPTDVENVIINISNVSSSGATVIIKDTNKEPYVYGEWYQLEKEKDGQWYEIKTMVQHYGFNTMGYIPDNNHEVKFEIDWEWLYGQLPSGNYRLLKEAGNQCISVEFRVNE